MLIFNAVVGVYDFGNQVVRVCFQRPAEAFQSLSIGAQRFSRNNLAVFHKVRVRWLNKDQLWLGPSNLTLSNRS